MKNKILAVMVLSTPALSIAKDIGYDYIEGTYSSVTIDAEGLGSDIDGNGLSVSGSASIAPNVALTAGFSSTNFDEFLGVDIDTTELSVGVTAHTSIADGTDVFGNVSVLKAEIEYSNGFNSIDDDDTGHIISIGLRHAASEVVEIEAGFSLVDIYAESENQFNIGVRFYASEKASLGIGYATADDTDALLLNARIDFK